MREKKCSIAAEDKTERYMPRQPHNSGPKTQEPSGAAGGRTGARVSELKSEPARCPRCTEIETEGSRSGQCG